MEGLSEIFESALPTNTLILSSSAFVLLYAAGFIVFQKLGHHPVRSPAIQHHFMIGLGAALAASAIGLGMHPMIDSGHAITGVPAATTPATELILSVDSKSLSVQEIEDKAFIFTKED